MDLDDALTHRAAHRHRPSRRQGSQPILAGGRSFHALPCTSISFHALPRPSISFQGWGTDDTALIRALCTRNKRSLARINIGYRAAYDERLQALIEGELGGEDDGMYLFLAKFLCVQEEQADSMLLDLAM